MCFFDGTHTLYISSCPIIPRSTRCMARTPVEADLATSSPWKTWKTCWVHGRFDFLKFYCTQFLTYWGCQVSCFSLSTLPWNPLSLWKWMVGIGWNIKFPMVSRPIFRGQLSVRHSLSSAQSQKWGEVTSPTHIRDQMLMKSGVKTSWGLVVDPSI